MIEGRKILVTGATGQVARPIAESLVGANEVWCTARFTAPALRAELEALGVRTFAWALGSDELDGLPRDFDYVVHAACHIFPVADDYDGTVATNAEGTGLLMTHCRDAEAMLYVSSLAVYTVPDDPRHPCREREAALGSHPPYAHSYGAGKVATEGVVRALARTLSLPVTIARLGMAYGTAGHGGVPALLFEQLRAGVEMDRPSPTACYSLISERDIVAHVEPLLGAAAVPATIVNWVSDEVATEREIHELVIAASGLAPNYRRGEAAAYQAALGDPTLRRAITGPTRTPWRQGVLAALRAKYPEHAFADVA